VATPTSPAALIIDDEPQMRRLLDTILKADGYRVSEAATGAEGLALAAQKQPEIILLDLGLPDLDGLEVLRRLREWSRVPVLILSVRDAEEQKVAALDAGADDYVTKPFASAELLARLRVMLRHGNTAALATPLPLFQAGALEVDLAARIVRVEGREVKLTATEYALLTLFIKHAGRVLTHRQILREVWGPRAEEHRQYLRVYVAHLRRKIEPGDGPPKLIVTESGVGYRLRTPE
jgi:two-component system, OmpR family, KDP operon response regulator KdpE